MDAPWVAPEDHVEWTCLISPSLPQLFPPLALLPPDFSDAGMCIKIPGSRGIRAQCAGEFLVMYCEGIFPRRARGTPSSKSREDKGGERPDGSGLWFSQEVKNFVQSRNKLDKRQSSCFLPSANESRGSYSWMPGWNTLSFQFRFLDTLHSAVSITV